MTYFKKVIAICLALFSLAGGIMIYLFLREPPRAIVNHISCTMAEGLSAMHSDGSDLPGWFTYGLPDMLWMFSFTLAVLCVWNFRICSSSKIWLFFVFTSGVGFEFLQLTPFINGVFDPLDVIFLSSGFLLAALFITPKKPYEIFY